MNHVEPGAFQGRRLVSCTPVASDTVRITIDVAPRIRLRITARVSELETAGCNPCGSASTTATCLPRHPAAVGRRAVLRIDRTGSGLPRRAFDVVTATPDGRDHRRSPYSVIADKSIDDPVVAR